MAQAEAHTPEIIGLAREVGDAYGLEAWLRRVWVFVPDPEFAEYVKSPLFQFYEALESFQTYGVVMFFGDCDDASTLAASILTTLGYPNWLEAIRYPQMAEYEHVFTNAQVGAEVLQIDPIVPAAEMPLLGVAERMEVPVWPT